LDTIVETLHWLSAMTVCTEITCVHGWVREKSRFWEYVRNSG